MAKLTDFNNPSFVMMPVNNNRTAWKPFAAPVMLIVPHKRNANGLALPNAATFGVRIYIEDVPREAKVAGHQNIGRRFPDKELYARTITALELAERQLDPDGLLITRDDVEVSEPEDGDLIHYTTRSGVRDTMPYLEGADYYDLSDIEIEVELLPSDKYNIVYETQYFKRVVSVDGQDDFLCIDVNTSSLALFKFEIDHPGQVLEEFYRLTPAQYLTNASKSKDRSLEVYRPLTDMLQDVMDEQTLLERVNWVFDAPPEAIPYLSSLLGWDIPYFPESLDQLRRAVLRRTVEFQNLKGSRRAITNIFRLFGFEILISNLWWSADGKRLIRPDETLPLAYQDQEIVTVGINQVDALLADYSLTGFTTLEIPLLFRPQEKNGLDQFTALRDNGQITVTFYAVEDGSEAQEVLDGVIAEISADPAAYGDGADCQTSGDGFLFPADVTALLSGKELAGYSQFRIAGKMGEPADSILVGKQVPVIADGLRFNRETNQLSVTFNGYSNLDGLKIYGLATYERYEFSVPDVLANLQSNRFDLQVLTQALDEMADPVTLEFAVEFLYKLKAFHSLLNVIRTRIELTETYQVTDVCVGGDYLQRYDTDMGRLQVPPAIIPEMPGDLADCSRLDPISLGYKDADIQYRLRKLANLEEEYASWKARTTGCGQGQDKLPSSATRSEGDDNLLAPADTANSGYSGFPTRALDAAGSGSFMREFREAVACAIGKAEDYCYKGRVEDEILYRPTVVLKEQTGIRPPYLGMGLGVYWTYPSTTKMVVPGVKDRDCRSLTNKPKFSGGSKEASRSHFSEGVQGPYLSQPYNQRQTLDKQSMLGKLYRDYGLPTGETIHFSNRGGGPIVDQRKQLALQRPSLEITKATMHLPGCRFPLLNRLKNDYVSDYEARPWDFEACGPKNRCGKTDPAYLNFRMEVDGDNESLVYDSALFTSLGNNLDADIPSLGEHGGGAVADADVVHKIFMEEAESHPAITLDGVLPHDTGVTDGLIDVTSPLFSSYSTSGSGMVDFADGYPALVGPQDYDAPTPGTYDDLLSALGMPDLPSTSTQVLFLLSSGIKDGSHCYRLDAGTSVAVEGGTILDATQVYRDEDDLLDFDPDHLRVEARLVAVESFKAETMLLNAQIPSLLELV